MTCRESYKNQRIKVHFNGNHSYEIKINGGALRQLIPHFGTIEDGKKKY